VNLEVTVITLRRDDCALTRVAEAGLESRGNVQKILQENIKCLEATRSEMVMKERRSVMGLGQSLEFFGLQRYHCNIYPCFLKVLSVCVSMSFHGHLIRIPSNGLRVHLNPV
jgi:hypothetical protein